MSLLTPQQRDQFFDDGWLLFEGAVPADLLASAQREILDVFPSAEEFADDVDPERNAPHRVPGASINPRFPWAGPSLNAIAVHDNLLDIAVDLLGTDDLRLYQGLISAKYSDASASYEQLLHADFGNHTLVVPRADVGYSHLEVFVYLSDVTEGTAATKVVSKRYTRDLGLPVNRTYLSYEEYPEIYRLEVPAEGPAGSLFLYQSDTYHRGVGMPAPRSSRYLMHVAFKPARADWLGFHSLPTEAERMEWYMFMTTATVRQLSVLGFPAPGDPYWNEATLEGVGLRYPMLDLTPWRQAMVSV